MRISGSFKELSFLIRLAFQTKGEYLYFGPEGDFWMVYNGGRVAYVKTKLDISHHIVMSWRCLANLHNTFVRIQTDEVSQSSLSYDWGQDYIRVDEEYIQKGFGEDNKITMNTHLERVKMFSPLVEKLEGMKFTPEPDGTPYVKIDYRLLRRYAKDIRAYFQEFGKTWNFYSRLLSLTDDETQNVLHIDHDGELGILRAASKKQEIPATKFRYTEGWFIPDKFRDHAFYMSDADFRLMMLAWRYESIEEFRILLFKDHYVIDAHATDLRFKIWLNRG